MIYVFKLIFEEQQNQQRNKTQNRHIHNNDIY